MNIFENKNNVKILMLLSVLYGVSFVMLLCFYRAGINFAIFTAFVLLGTFWALKYKDSFNKALYIFISSCIFILSLTPFLSTNTAFININTGIIPLLYILCVCLSINKSENIIGRFFITIFLPIANLGKLPVYLINSAGEKSTGFKPILRVLFGIIAGAALIYIIVPLMFSADYAFAEVTGRIFKNLSFSTILIKTLIGIFVCLYAFAFIFTTYNNKALDTNTYPNDKERFSVRHKTLEEKIQAVDNAKGGITAFLLSVLCVLIVFCTFQIIYLFMRVNAGLPEGFDYADYARSGVFALWVLTAIDLMIVLLSKRNTSYLEKVKQVRFKIIYTVYTVCNIIMTSASAYKMNMYINEYGFTRARLIVMIYLSLQLIMLLILLAGLFIDKIHFLKTALIIVLCSYSALNLINIDAITARLIINRYDSTGKIDESYLINGLSYDALNFTVEHLSSRYDFKFTYMNEEEREAFNTDYSTWYKNNHYKSYSRTEDDTLDADIENYYMMQEKINTLIEKEESLKWQESNLIIRNTAEKYTSEVNK